MRGSALAIKPSLVPALGVTRQLGLRKGSVPSPLNGDAAKLYAGAIGELSLMIDIEEFTKEQDSWCHLKVHFAENLKLAEVGN